MALFLCYSMAATSCTSTGALPGQSCKADRGPCADAGISELLVEIFGDNVSNFGMGGVIGCCVDVNGQREDLCNPLVR